MKQLVLMLCSFALVFAVPGLAIDIDLSNAIGPSEGTSVAEGQCPCPGYADPENETTCFDGYVDNYNGGCNSTPPVFSTVTCSPICGEAGVFTTNAQEFRDTDWYRLNVVPGNYSVSGTGDGFVLQIAVVTDVCPPEIIGNLSAGGCAPVGPINFAVESAGTVVIFAASDFSNSPGVPPCGTKYTLNISGPGVVPCAPTPVETSTWGNIKATYQ